MYRELAITTPEPIKRNIFKYVVHNSLRCPVCDTNIDDKYWGYKPQPMYYGKRKFCHPLKRIIVRGFWWWRKYCPVDGIHHHCYCNSCKIKWVCMFKDQSGANPEIKSIDYE